MSLGEVIALGVSVGSSFTIILGVISYFLIFPLYKKVGEIEVEIIQKKRELHSLPEIISKRHGTILKARYEQILSVESKKIEDELDTLETKRRFLLDKIPLISFMKK